MEKLTEKQSDDVLFDINFYYHQRIEKLVYLANLRELSQIKEETKQRVIAEIVMHDSDIKEVIEWIRESIGCKKLEGLLNTNRETFNFYSIIQELWKLN